MIIKSTQAGEEGGLLGVCGWSHRGRGIERCPTLSTSGHATRRCLSQTLRRSLPAMQSDDPVSVLRNAFTTRLIMFCKLFKRWDYERNGTISPKEFRAALRSMELPHAADDEVCDSIFDEIDSDHSGLVTEYECQRYAVLLLLQSQVNRLHNLFKLWDVDCSGAIDKEEWRDAIKALGIEAPIVAVDRLFRELDEDRSGELVYEELNKKLRSLRAQWPKISSRPHRAVRFRRSGVRSLLRARWHESNDSKHAVWVQDP